MAALPDDTDSQPLESKLKKVAHFVRSLVEDEGFTFVDLCKLRAVDANSAIDTYIKDSGETAICLVPRATMHQLFQISGCREDDFAFLIKFVKKTPHSFPLWSVSPSPLALRKWLSFSQCLVCFDYPKTSEQSCPVCGSIICAHCDLDLMRVNDENDDLHRVCPNCRNYDTAAECVVSLMSAFVPFDGLQLSGAQKRFIFKWTGFAGFGDIAPLKDLANTFCPYVTKETMLDLARDYALAQSRKCCANCGKRFWDKKEWKKAPKCTKCKVVAYCNAKCRKANRRMHAIHCGMYETKPQRVKPKKAAKAICRPF